MASSAHDPHIDPRANPRTDPHARIVYKPVTPHASASSGKSAKKAAHNPFLRAENEDDDGYDPYSDRPAEREPLFEENPWD